MFRTGHSPYFHNNKCGLEILQGRKTGLLKKQIVSLMLKKATEVNPKQTRMQISNQENCFQESEVIKRIFLQQDFLFILY